ncbi:hypothetical protein QBC42DRAFT_290813 [Cladorrhinum samala]|uniref:Uncharacterized protein n=1 Tax=Cladorrhinum samala TaxID=585594 RepID=A0AAV9HF23_9PEZI|nr:hypothetical protein QBC42DRAFT_290813 [Cladorrhinum samala]
MKYFTLATAAIMSTLGSLAAAQTLNEACAPKGTHPKPGTPTCHCNTDGSVSCDAFELCGVGNTNANVALTSTYTATVRCRNNGGQIVDVKTQSIVAKKDISSLELKNGCLVVPSQSTKPAPTKPEFEARATCPNPNWTKELLGDTVRGDYVFTVTFANSGSCGPYLTITGTCTG